MLRRFQKSMRVHIPLIWVTTLASCANPAASVKDDVMRFQKQFPTQLKTIDHNGTLVHYAWSGNPKLRPLLFVHGSPGSWEGWAHFLMDENLQKKFHMIAVDRPGYGKTNPGISEASLKKQAELVASPLSENQSHFPAILVGHSFGGPVIAAMAMEFPEKVASLIFVASSVAPELERTKWFQYPASWWPIRLLVPGNLRVCNEEIFALKKELIQIVPDWKNIHAKVIVIHGEEDPLVPVENSDFIKDHLKPDLLVDLQRIPDLNHFVPWKRPDLILGAIEKLEGVIK